jgi:hypothetical protein
MANDPVTDGVLAHLGDQTNLSAQAAGGQGLIGPFSAMGGEQRAAGDRLTFPREAFDGDGKI